MAGWRVDWWAGTADVGDVIQPTSQVRELLVPAKNRRLNGSFRDREGASQTVKQVGLQLGAGARGCSFGYNRH
jgi:hypothetical protein